MTDVKGFSIRVHDYHTDKTVFITNTAHDVATVTITMRDTKTNSPDLSDGKNVGEINLTVKEFYTLVEKLNIQKEKFEKSMVVPATEIMDDTVTKITTTPAKKKGRPKKVINDQN